MTTPLVQRLWPAIVVQCKRHILYANKPKLCRLLTSSLSTAFPTTNLSSLRSAANDTKESLNTASESATDTTNVAEAISKRRQLLQIQPSTAIQRQVDALRLGIVKKSRFGIGRPGKEARETRKTYEEERRTPNIELPTLMFFAGAKSSTSFPPETLPEAAFVGRSNVGKSSLLNALARFTKPARVSDKPGLTQQINFFTAGRHFHLVDMPGYGFAFAKSETIEAWQSAIDVYLSTRQTLKRVYVLIDSRHGLKSNDKEFIKNLDAKISNCSYKCDLVLRNILVRRCQAVMNELSDMSLRHVIAEPIMVSAKMGPGVDVLRRDILHALHSNHLLPKPGASWKENKESKEKTTSSTVTQPMRQQQQRFTTKKPRKS
ncbi:P-loop containing nucleoside triphosphate hydrolase protein [Syncephalis fuscata]|nr:P-loop containing nucleoside triphosphate hydrolase protein [Syncephalis fuscata]